MSAASPLPGSDEIHQAISIYVRHAYEGGEVPASAADLLPPDGEFDVGAWIMADMVEREPSGASLADVRIAYLRLGNAVYPNMKFRLSRAPKDGTFLLSVDAHDAMLHAPAGTPDQAMLEELKTHNARLRDAIQAEWDAAGLPTERNYMRRLIERRKAQMDSE